jgi:uncharacterized membrane protein (UPF0136 family)
MASTDVISNWSTLIENLETSPLGFFGSVEAGIQKRCIPVTQTSRVDHYESGMFSAKREYMRVTRDKLIFDICASPYGTGFFVSWWLGSPTVQPLAVIGIIIGYFVLMGILMNLAGFFMGLVVSLVAMLVSLFIISSIETATAADRYVLAIPFVGYLYKRFFKPDTYYSIDTTTMFQAATHAAVLEAVDEIMSARGLRLLSESERRPTMRAALKR